MTMGQVDGCPPLFSILDTAKNLGIFLDSDPIEAHTRVVATRGRGNGTEDMKGAGYGKGY